jgi:poly(A) polymerase
MAAGGAAEPPVRYLGVSEPVSIDGPTPADLKRTAELETFLEQHNRFENRADKQHRETVLATLSKILCAWVKTVSLALDPPLSDPGCHRAHLFSFGSYRLGVNAHDADIDTVCVLPSHIDAFRDFFGLEAADAPDTGNKWRTEDRPDCILQEIFERDPRVTDLVAVSGAFTPILTFLFNGVEIDIACGIVAQRTLPEVLLLSLPPLLASWCLNQAARCVSACWSSYGV